MTIFYGGEDDVTRWIAKRLALESIKDLEITNAEIQPLGFRERGSAIIGKLSQIVSLGQKYPVIFVMDSDGDCVLDILNKGIPNGWKNTFASINIAIDEGESWLLADDCSFSKYFGVGTLDIKPNGGEVTFPYKTSMYIMREIIPKSSKRCVRDNLCCTEKGHKPPTYNLLWEKYIMEQWNVENASGKARSLERAVKRIKDKVQDSAML